MGDTSQYRSIDRKDELYYCSNWLSTYGRRCPSNFRRMPSIVSLLSPKPKAAAMVVYLSAANERDRNSYSLEAAPSVRNS